MKDPDFLVSNPVAWGPCGVPGAKEGTCSRCATAVHLSPSSQRYLAARAVPVLCVPCASAVHPDGPLEVAIMPGQVDELRDARARARRN